VELAADAIEFIRAKLATAPANYKFAYGTSSFGAARWPELTDRSEADVITSHRLATGASVPRCWGIFLRLCIEAFEARLVLELGTCLGISGAYMASSSSQPRLVTLEGSRALPDVATTTIAAVSPTADIIRGPFEQTLPTTLDRLRREQTKIDVVYLDGHHDASATLYYVRSLIPHLAPESLVVLDDVYLFRDMWRAWETLSQTPGMTTALNIGRFGLLVFSERPETVRSYDLSRFTGWWRVGGSRKA
jgi:predicted O-methyltransferase YrrM